MKNIDNHKLLITVSYKKNHGQIRQRKHQINRKLRLQDVMKN